MANDYSLVTVSAEPVVFDVEISAKRISQVGIIDGEWRFRLDPDAAWSTNSFGSEFEASELLLVERGLLEIPPNGVVVSKVTVHKSTPEV